MSDAAIRPPKLPPRWFVHTAWRAHRALYRLSGGRFLWTTSNIGAPASAPGARTLLRGEERDRLWQRWVALDPNLDAYAGRRSTQTPVIALEPRDATA